MRSAALLTLFLLAVPGEAQDIELQRKHTRWRIGLEQLELDDDSDVGLLGVHYDLLGVVPQFPPLYLGLGVLLPVTADDAGFFMGGLTVGTIWHPRPLWLVDVGAMVGGGGGIDGGPTNGWAARPFVALERIFGLYGIRAELAYIDLDDLDGNWAFSLGLSLPSELLVAREAELNRQIPERAVTKRQIRMTPRYLWLDPESGAKRRSGAPLKDEIGMIGLGVDYFATPMFYIPFEAHGAVSGDVDGLVLASVGLGASIPLSRTNASVEAKISAVTAGGGDVDTGSDLGWQAMIGVRAPVMAGLALELMGGTTRFPGGDFDANAVSLGLSWTGNPVELALDYPRGNLGREGLSSKDAQVRQTRLTFISKTYSPTSSAKKENGDEHEGTLSLAGVGVEEPITESISMVARAYAAYDGRIGGYTEGILGLRYDLPELPGLPRNHIGLIGEIGAAGGGGVDVESGLIYNFGVGWRYDFSRDTHVFIEYGKTHAKRGSFEAEAVTIGIGWNLHRAFLRD